MEQKLNTIARNWLDGLATEEELSAAGSAQVAWILENCKPNFVDA